MTPLIRFYINITVIFFSTTHIMNTVTLLVNNEAIFKFNKEILLNEEQLAFFDKMDSDMKNGIKLQGKLISKPDAKQRSTFVAMNLIKALQQDNQAAISSSCAYLVDRHPALIEIYAKDHENEIRIELVEEEQGE